MSTKDVYILKTLIKIEKRIRDLYKKLLEYGCHNCEHITKEILGLIDSERSYMRDLNLTSKQLETIKAYLMRKVKLSFDCKAFKCLKNDINHDNYAYYRLYIKLEELRKEQELAGLDQIDLSLTRDLVTVLFRVLIDSCQNKNYDVVNKLMKKAMLILVESTPVEIEMLKVSMIPPKIINFCLTTTFDLSIALQSKVNPLTIEEIGFKIDRVENGQKQYLKIRFNEHYNEIMEVFHIEALKIQDLYKDAKTIFYISYIEALTAFLPLEERMSIYRAFLKSCKKEDAFNVVRDRISYLERELIPSIERASLFRPISFNKV